MEHISEDLSKQPSNAMPPEWHGEPREKLVGGAAAQVASVAPEGLRQPFARRSVLKKFPTTVILSSG